MGLNVDSDNKLDAAFSEIGEFGLFQIFAISLICIPSIISSSHIVNFMFAIQPLKHRCKVPECDFGDNNREISYNQTWLEYAIPQTQNGYENCVRYESIQSSANTCDVNSFNTSKQIECTEFIYATDEISIQTEFNIHCDDIYKLPLIGSINNIGRLIFLPITGILKDKFGRLRIVLISMFLCSLLGFIKSFSFNYEMYIALEFFEASANTCVFSGIYLLAIEWVSSKYRAICSTLVILSLPIGEIIFGFLAMYIHNFRHLLRVIYAPGLFVFIYFWLVPESIQWLLVNGRVDGAIKVLQRIAKVNGKILSENSINALHLQYTPDEKNDVANENKEKNVNKVSITEEIKQIFGSSKLLIRLLTCCYLWISCFFSFYGLSYIVTQMSGNRYINFIIVEAVEIPSDLLPAYFLNKFRRKPLLFCTFLLTGITSLTSIVVKWMEPQGQSMIMLILFMIGKSSITFSYDVLLTFNAELWPTNTRGTILDSCLTVGRIGAILAPLTTLLIVKAPFVPFVLFGSTACLAAVLVLMCPETYGKKLPDTIKEAKDL